MTIDELREHCDLTVLTAPPDGGSREITGCYLGDFLSWAMGKISAGDVWVTVMGNVNALAVAALTDAACIVLAEGARLDPEAFEKAQEQELIVLASEKSSYALAVRIGERLA